MVFRKLIWLMGMATSALAPTIRNGWRVKSRTIRTVYSSANPYPTGVNAYTWELPSEVHSSNYIGERTAAFLQTAGDAPFFLQVSFPDPHYPFTVPEPYASLYGPDELPAPLPPVTESHDLPALHEQIYFRRSGTVTRPDGRPVDRIIGTPPHDYSQCSTEDWQQVKALYYGMISLIDDNVGRILDALEAGGLAENTVVVFLSDHGDYLGDHGFYGKGLPYDSVLRVPCIWRGPGIKAQTNRRGGINN